MQDRHVNAKMQRGDKEAFRHCAICKQSIKQIQMRTFNVINSEPGELRILL